jgi:formylglycine-generating enzyme required for sulfatase activity
MEKNGKLNFVLGVLLYGGFLSLACGQSVTPGGSTPITTPLVSDAPDVPLDRRADMVWVEGREVSWNLPDALGRQTKTANAKLLSPGFYMDRSEVTNRQFALFLSEADSHEVYYDPRMDIIKTARNRFSPRTKRDDFPVAWVDWRGAFAFAKWAGKSLPTEDEWIIAALSGRNVDKNGSLLPGVDTTFRTATWLNSISQRSPGPAIAGSFPQTTTSTGISDLAGNVAEWTLTEVAAPIPGGGSTTWLVIKGGSYLDPPENLSLFSRTYRLPSERLSSVGFRCVLRVPR